MYNTASSAPQRVRRAPAPRGRGPADPNALAPTLGWLAAAFALASLVGFTVGPLVPPSMTMPISVGVTVLLLASVVLRKIPGFSYVLLALVPSALGIMIYSIIEATISEGNSSAVVISTVGTAIIFTVTAVVAWFTKKTIYRITGVLFGITLAILAISLLNTFVFHLSILSLIISFAVIVVFTIWTFVDIQRVRDGRGKPVEMALSIFIDIVNIFLSLLNITRSFSN